MRSRRGGGDAGGDAKAYLLDTNSVIESVRCGIWNAITGNLSIETVEECRKECLRGDTLSGGYIVVSDAELDRLTAVHPVTGSHDELFRDDGVSIGAETEHVGQASGVRASYDARSRARTDQAVEWCFKQRSRTRTPRAYETVHVFLE